MRSYRNVEDLARVVLVLLETINGIGVFMESIVAQLVLHVESDHHKAGQTKDQSADIQQGEALPAGKIANGRLQNSSKHLYLFLLVDKPIGPGSRDVRDHDLVTEWPLRLIPIKR